MSFFPWLLTDAEVWKRNALGSPRAPAVIQVLEAAVNRANPETPERLANSISSIP
jgi:hypothetical protein